METEKLKYALADDYEMRECFRCGDTKPTRALIVSGEVNGYLCNDCISECEHRHLSGEF